MTPLHVSCFRCDTAAVVDEVYRSDVNMQERDGKTAMLYACKNGHFDILRVLLSVFADTDITNDDGRTPAAECEYWGSPELAHYIKRLMHVPSNNDINGSISAATPTIHLAPFKLENNVYVKSRTNNYKTLTSQVENSKLNKKCKHYCNICCCNIM